MTKAESEPKVRYLAGVWAKETGYIAKPGHYPSYSSFKSWMDAKGYGHYLQFRSRCGADYDAEHWLEEELKPRVF